MCYEIRGSFDISTSSNQPEAAQSPVALIVDLNRDARTTLCDVASSCGYVTSSTDSRSHAMDVVTHQRPDLVMLDLSFPDGSAIDLLSDMRDIAPSLSVVVLSSKAGREHSGTRTFVWRHQLSSTNRLTKRELRFVYDQVRQTLAAEHDARQALEFVVDRRTELTLDSNPDIVGRVVKFLIRDLRHHFPGYDLPQTGIQLALFEALANAIEHGNLEITFEEKTEAMATEQGVRGLIRERVGDDKYAGRSVHVLATYEPSAVHYTIRDEGPGFEPTGELSKPWADTTALHGRGLQLILHHMDSVSWNLDGNQIQMTRRFARRTPRKTAVIEPQRHLGVTPMNKVNLEAAFKTIDKPWVPEDRG